MSQGLKNKNDDSQIASVGKSKSSANKSKPVSVLDRVAALFNF